MSGKTHQALGLLAGAGAAVALNAGPYELYAATGACFIASRVPDWDQCAPLSWFVVHRGVTHWFLTALILAALIAAGTASLAGPEWVLPVAGGFLLGYVLHLLADMATPQGLRALRPFTTRRVHVLPRPIRFYI